MSMTSLGRRGAAVLLAMAWGCGLIDPDITAVTFELPTRTYHFDTTMWNLPQGANVAVPCGTGQIVADCCSPPPPLPAPDCAMTPITCEPDGQGMNVCTATVTVSDHHPVNLGQEVSVLNGVTSIANITIKAIDYTISNNTFNIDLPPVEIFLAPDGVTDPGDSRARKFGTVPSIPAGMNVSGRVVLESNAGQTFASFTSNLSTPFTFIARTVVKTTGSPLPSGAIDIAVTGTLSASL